LEGKGIRGGGGNGRDGMEKEKVRGGGEKGEKEEDEMGKRWEGKEKKRRMMRGVTRCNFKLFRM
jgi:hypothetical protein